MLKAQTKQKQIHKTLTSIGQQGRDKRPFLGIKYITEKRNEFLVN